MGRGVSPVPWQTLNQVFEAQQSWTEVPWGLGSPGLSRALRAVSGPSPRPVPMEMKCPLTLPGDPEGPETAAAGGVRPGTWSGGSSAGQGPPTTSAGSTRFWFSETALPSDGWMVPLLLKVEH